MAFSVSSVLSMGSSALSAFQAAISTTGNNISNVNTTGYSRQSVVYAERSSLDAKGGQIGQGVTATEVVRAYDRFIESSLLSGLTSAARENTAYSSLSLVEGVFNSSLVSGLDDALLSFFNAWNDLSQNPDSSATKEALLGYSHTLASSLREMDATLAEYQRQLDSQISADVDSVNSLITEIARLNKEINIHTVAGSNNANALMDTRDQLARQLSEFIDIKVDDKGAGDYTITTTSGNLLVQQDVAYSLSFEGPRAHNSLTANSPYKNSSGSGTIGFSGTDTNEYTVEIVDLGGDVDDGAMFIVSLDGGRTWLTEDGATSNKDSAKRFEANSEETAVTVGKLTLWFDKGESLAEGDKFTISPKSDVYWVSPTSGPINISTQSYGDGTENSLRITGGSLAGYLSVRDQMIGDYRDQLDALAQGIIWEVNRIYSQGSTTDHMSYANGTTQVGNAIEALGSDSAGLVWSDKLSTGNISFGLYDSTTGESLVPYPGLDVFSGTNFDPSMSLKDVCDAINDITFEGQLVFEASYEPDNSLKITTKGDYTFAVTSDTTGLLAALGINTYFSGDCAENIAVRTEVASDANNINVGRINGAGEVNEGDNLIAKDIAGLVDKKVSIGVKGKENTQTLSDYYATLVTKVGSDTLDAKTRSASQSTLAQTLLDKREEVSGVSLDEEMSNLIKFQASYKAAAKLITTADEMLQTIIGLKQ
ncbi:flagellar hook-associated protein FlgK [Desulfovibrio sp. OttesenSCG-928-G15]|nr:flagellar hook-associated protein FlgK [Desulfovibrio sp. OttesenSCG-928-G15]